MTKDRQPAPDMINQDGPLRSDRLLLLEEEGARLDALRVLDEVPEASAAFPV